MVTFAQAQERAEEWINADLPAYQHREVRVREFELGFVVWAEDREDGPRSDGGRQRLVIARDSGEATLWPGLPVGEVIRRYEEEYGAPADAGRGAAPAPPERIDLNQTSFLLSPPEWLQDAADRMGLPKTPDTSGAGGGPSAPGPADEAGTAEPLGRPDAADRPEPDREPTARDGVPARTPADSPWADANAGSGGVDGVPLPATVFAPPLSGADDEDTPLPMVGADTPTALMSGGSALPPTAVAPRLEPSPPGPDGPADRAAPPAAPGTPPPAPAPPGAPGAADIADAATSKASAAPRTPRGGTGNPPPPPQAPGTPGRPAAPSGGGGYIPTQLVPQLGPDGPQPPGPPAPPTPEQPVHQAATMLARPPQGGPGGPPPPPPPPGVPGTPPGGVPHAATVLAQPGPGDTPAPPGPPGAPAPPGPAGAHHAATVLAPPGPGTPPPPAPAPGAPPAYGYPQQPAGPPTVGPGYQAVLRYRAPDGSEAQIIRRSAPGTPHPEWQILHELRAMNVPPQQVLELHTELESCELPGGYCARMIRETWPQARITNIAPYGRDHAGRRQGVQQLLTHQGELHQVADGPARPAPVRAPLPQVQPLPPVPPEGVAQEMAGAFGPGICRFDQRAVSRQGVPEIVALTLVWAGLPADFGPFFWAQPAHPVVPTLAELAAQRQIQPASDAGSYLVIGSDFGRAICVQYGTAHIVAVPVEAGPGGQPVPPQFVNSGLPEFARCMALLGRMWRLRFGLNPEQAGRWTVDFQAQLAMLDPAALSSPDTWWSVLLEQMWDGLL
ncbi:SUKH-4 family immunity protein [Streptomyces sp. NBC_01216]|uniref:SUKH-4 family immunity protein n=1 Tax=Streptomyces sp. NBC_01216 TaxID=2903778 RepID=UPI002E12366E|nr:SUKH-4 family immunity protein [Streptomyces sp. NBC_01216]